MSGRGGGGRGGRGGWRGRGGRGGAPGLGPGPIKDEDGNVIDTQPAGPPPRFPEVELPPHPDISAKDELHAEYAEKLKQAMSKSPFVLEPPKEEKGDVDTLIERYSSRQAVAGRKRKREREPLTSVIKLLPEYLPEELYSSSDKRYAKLQSSYFKRAASKADDAGLSRLDALAQLESAAQAKGGQGEGDEGEGEVPEEVVDTDEEEEMDGDDYYQGDHFDDDEEYGDDLGDDGGDDGPTYVT